MNKNHFQEHLMCISIEQKRSKPSPISLKALKKNSNDDESKHAQMTIKRKAEFEEKDETKDALVDGAVPAARAV